jgi:hypothetical protein
MRDGTEKPLERSPFVCTFEYGADSEGYWNYNHMVIQLEDCVDVLNPNGLKGQLFGPGVLLMWSSISNLFILVL